MHIGHVATRVADIEVSSKQVMEALGLSLTSGSDDEAYLTANSKHHELQFLRSTQPGLDHIGLEVADAGELEECLERAVAAGAKVVSEGPEEAGIENASRIQGPAGLVFEIYTPMTAEPLQLGHVIGRHARKLGHVTLASSEGVEVIEFLVDGLGFRISDRFGTMAWLRCDIDHHGLAVICGAPANLMHHYAFELNGWDGMRMYLDDLAVRGERIVWGPGRHGPGFNLFTYLPEPSGALIEGYAGLLKIEDEENYVPVNWDEIPDAINIWGPEVPQSIDTFGVPILGAESKR